MDPTHTRVSVDGTEVDVTRAGSGPPLLYLHGGGGAEPWTPFHADLAKRFTLIQPTHPGWGEQWMPDWLEGIEDLVLHYAAFIEDQGLGRPVVFGNSLGGWIAAELAVYRPDLVSGMILVDPAGFRPENPDWQMDLFYEAPEELLGKLFADPEKAAALMPPEGVTTDFIVRQYRGSAALARLMWRRNYDPKLRRRAARIKAPTLVIWGDSDQLIHPEHGRTVARDIPGAEFVLIGNAGHIPYLEQPQATLEAILRFADRHGLAGRARAA
jgi:pimeloyl-ACP methyl ester carboxylesterase